MKVWAIGTIEHRTKHGIVKTVPNRKSTTLIPIIQQYILLGTTTISDDWKPFRGLPCLGYEHKIVNHSEEFMNAEGWHNDTLNICGVSCRQR